MEVDGDKLASLYSISGWESYVPRDIINLSWTGGFSFASISVAQYGLLYLEATKSSNSSTYQTLSTALKKYCPDFTEPKHYSELTRKFTRNLNKMQDLSSPIILDKSESDIGPHCNKLGITKGVFENLQLTSGHPLTLGAFHEICLFKESGCKKWNHVKQFIENIQPVGENKIVVSVEKLIRLHDKVSSNIQKLSKNKKKAELDEFKSIDFFSFSNVSKTNACVSCSAKSVTLKKLGRTSKHLLNICRNIETEKQQLVDENAAYADIVHEQSEQIKTVQKKLNSLSVKSQKSKKLKLENKALNEKLKVCNKNIMSIKKDNFYKRLKRRETNIVQKSERQKFRLKNAKNALRTVRKEKENILQRLSESNELNNNNKKILKVKTHQFSNRNNYLKNVYSLEKRKTGELKKELEDLKQENIILKQQNDIITLQTEDSNMLNTKEGGRFSDDMRICVMDIAGMDIATNKIPGVINSVGKQLFKKEIQTPSKTTIQKIVDESQLISKVHVGEQILQCDHWGIFSDGTSREGEKILNVGVNLDKKTYSLGYETVAREDAETVSTVIRNSIKETADLNNCDLSSYLKKLSTFMSDRASVMKRTNVVLDQWRKYELSKTMDPKSISNVEFLYCSAHVLLGFQDKIESKFREIEKDSGPLGRDNSSKFNRFKNSEPSFMRLIRTACDILGPRGDEKSGVRQQWLAYMKIKGKKSKIISFRSNRFDSLFKGASCLVFHRDDIVDFLENHFQNPNLKLQSVLLDMKSDIIFHHLLSLALIGCIVTGPYWNLINSDEHHLDLYQFIQPLHSKLESWSTDPSEILSNRILDPIFEKFPHDVATFDSLFLYINTMCEQVKPIVSIISKCLLDVVERQLKDYLQNEKFGKKPSVALRNKTSHAKLTNIQAENIFGDLDFSMNRKRNASIFHHSSISMLKRNKTVDWLNKKTDIARKNLLNAARKKQVELRMKHKIHVQSVTEQRKNILQEIKRKKVSIVQKHEKELKTIEQNVRKMGGVVKSRLDIDCILKTGKSIRNKKEILRFQLLYCKHFLNITVSLNETAWKNTVIQMKESLVKYLKLDECKELKVGTWIAVSYEDDWYPGEILKISQEKFTTKFMKRNKKGGIKFIWPDKEDIQDIDKKFIIFSHFDIVPSPGLRFWFIPDVEDIQMKHDSFVDTYFH